MLKKLLTAAATTALLCLAQGAVAQSWTLDGDSSRLAFGSVKKDTAGEVHSFETLTGTVGADGAVALTIDLASVETNIEIRNERMIEYVFQNAPAATLAAQIDMAALNAIAVGASDVVDVEGTLSLIGTQVDIEAEMYVTRLSETRVMVMTNDMIFLGTEQAGITAGIDKLMELAKLPGITRTVPVTLRLVFQADAQKAGAAETPAAPVTLAAAGDAKAGKKVFRKCKACHSLKEGKSGVGPSLHNIIGAKSGAAEGFRYSSAMAEAGLTWDEATLHAFLSKPKKVIPGTKMAFSGLKKDSDIDNLLAYLASE